MSEPKLEVVPLRPAVRSDLPTTLDVLLKVTPPLPEITGSRPPLNLGFVIDRSGSMGEARKITFAREAVAFAVRELAATDRVSVTIFDDQIETIVPNGPAADKDAICRLIDAIQPRNTTALHGGWQEGGRQVQTHRQSEGVNRVILLSDGLANVGESRPDKIADDVHKLAEAGVSTTTLGLGDQYNEDLLEAMARSGDGNYYYVEGASQLPGIFRTEMQGLNATAGIGVTLYTEPASGVTVADLLNEFDRTPDGGWKLPNLVGGMPVLVLVRLNVSAFTGEKDVVRFRLDWQSPKDDIRHTATVGLTLPAVPSAVWDGLADNFEVRELAVLLQAARNKKEAARLMAIGDRAGSAGMLNMTVAMCQEAPSSSLMDEELAALGEVQRDLDNDDAAKFSKRAKQQAYQRSSNKPYTPPADEK